MSLATAAPSKPSATRPTATLLAAQGIEMHFSRSQGPPVAALKGVSLAARRAQVTGLVGPDGAGKTTLLRIAAGLLVPTAGTMTVLGHDSVKATEAMQRCIGYMPQQFGLYEDLTVQENMALYADLQQVPPHERQARYATLLQMTGLAPFTGRRAGRLSGGMQQKLGLACALIKAPQLLILDEPTVGVDPVSRRDLWHIVYRLVDQDGIGVVLSTAYLDEAEHCQHIVLLHEGHKLDAGPPAHFHQQVQRRVFLVTPPQPERARPLQAQLAQYPAVVDATIRAGRVRIVLQRPTDLPLAFLAETAYARLEPAAPVFEDAFVAALAQAGVVQRRLQASEPGPTPALPAEGPAPVVQIEQLTKTFGTFTAVSDISFTVQRGEIFGLLGANGAGKSTTFRMLCGLLPASSGRIRVAGHDLRHSPAAARARLGYMAQKFSLYQQLSVAHNLRFYARAYGLFGQQLRHRLDWALEEFDLRERARLPAGSLPGGYRQRLAMATAMLHQPDILFLDEPTSGADPLARREFWLRINGFAQQGVTVIVTTHFMEEAEFCDEMLIMARGQPLAQGQPAAIRALARTAGNPEPTVEDAFIALAQGQVSVPTPDGKVA